MTVANLAREYECARLIDGATVAEWEARAGLAPYSVYPEARDRGVGERGYFMYRVATEEERAKLAWSNRSSSMRAYHANKRRSA